MKTFAEHFCLKDGVENLVPDGRTPGASSVSSEALIAVEAILKKASRAKRAPRMVMVGDYGSGKTHTLFYIADVIKQKSLPFRPLHVTCPDLSKATSFNSLFQRLLSQIDIETLKSHLGAHIEKNPQWLKGVRSYDMKCAITHLAFSRTTDALAFQFLSGQKLKKAEQLALGLRKQQLTAATDFAAVMKALSEVMSSQTNEKLLYLVDEWENVSALMTKEALNSWKDSMRAFLSIKDVGFVVAVAGESLQELPPILLETEIVKLIGRKNYLYLEQYNSTQIASFLTTLLKSLVDPQRRQRLELKAGLKQIKGYSANTYPFTTQALAGFSHYLAADYANAKPSSVLAHLHTTALAAMQRGQHVVDKNLLVDIGRYKLSANSHSIDR